VLLSTLPRPRRGLLFYTPSSAVHFKLPATATAPNDHATLSALDIFASRFDLEEGVIAAERAYIISPLGIRIGRLVENPNGQTLATFYSHAQHPYSSNLGHDIGNVKLEILGTTHSNCYDGRHLLMMPRRNSNGASLVLREASALSGPLILHGTIVAHADLVYESESEATITDGKLLVEGNLSKQGRGSVIIKPVIARGTYTYHTYGWRRYSHPNSILTFVISESGCIDIHGELDAVEPFELILEGASGFYARRVSPAISVQQHKITSSLYQNVYYDEELKRALNSPTSYPAGVPITGPSNSHAGNGCVIYARQFLYATNTFRGARQVFTPSVSFEKPTALTSNSLVGALQAPQLLVLFDRQGLILGDRPLYSANYASQVSDEAEVPTIHLNLSTTFMTNAEEYRTRNLTAPGIHFWLRERFFFRNHAAQAFYTAILPHIWIKTPDNTYRRADNPKLFALSPKLLLQYVRERCQSVLRRAYITEGESLDLKYVVTLHQNATECFEGLQGSSGGLGSQTFKPMIFYVPLLSEAKVEQLNPIVYFPRALREAVNLHGGFIQSNTLFALPTTMIQQRQLIARIAGTFGDVSGFYLADDTNSAAELPGPGSAGSFIGEAMHIALSETPGSSPTSGQSREDVGDATYRGGASGDQNVLLWGNNIQIEGEALVRNAFFLALQDIRMTPHIQRTHHGDGFRDTISERARVVAKEVITMLAGRNWISVGAETQSGIRTHTEALANILSVPAMLVEHYVSHHSGNLSGTETVWKTTADLDKHVSKELGLIAHGKCTLQGTKLQGDRIVVAGAEGVTLDAASDEISRQISLRTRKRGLFCTRRKTLESSHTSNSQPVAMEPLNSPNAAIITSKTGDIEAIGTEFGLPQTILVNESQGRVQLTAAQSSSTSATASSKRGFFTSKSTFDSS